MNPSPLNAQRKPLQVLMQVKRSLPSGGKTRRNLSARREQPSRIIHRVVTMDEIGVSLDGVDQASFALGP